MRAQREDHPIVASIARLFIPENEILQPLPRPKTPQPPEIFPAHSHQRPNPNHPTPSRGAFRGRRRINVADLGRPLPSLPDPPAREGYDHAIKTKTPLIYPPKYPSPPPSFLEDTPSLMCLTTPEIPPLMSLVIPKPNPTPEPGPTPDKKSAPRHGPRPTRVKDIYLFGNQSCWRCGKEGHSHRECRANKEWRYCYLCGFRNVDVTKCPQCSESWRRDQKRK